MMSYFGVSHRQHPGDLEGFLRAMVRVQLLPMIGFLVPFFSLLFTRGLDISWQRGVPPPNWYGWQLAFSGFGFCFIYPWYMYSKNKLKRMLGAEEDVGLYVLMPMIFGANSDRLWQLFYRVAWTGAGAKFLLGMLMSWGVSGLVYFQLGAK